MMVVCALCASDESVEYDRTTNVALCTGPGHPWEHMWEPIKEAPKRSGQPPTPAADSIADRFGLHDKLVMLLNPNEWADTYVVEHRFRTAHPEDYVWMVDRWGHVAQGERRYSTSAYIGSTLGHMTRAVDLAYRDGPATGMFSYNVGIGMWGLPGTASDAEIVTWDRCATSEGFSPNSWPLLDYDGDA
jgi:hypothetical protein